METIVKSWCLKGMQPQDWACLFSLSLYFLCALLLTSGESGWEQQIKNWLSLPLCERGSFPQTPVIGAVRCWANSQSTVLFSRAHLLNVKVSMTAKPPGSSNPIQRNPINIIYMAHMCTWMKFKSLWAPPTPLFFRLEWKTGEGSPFLFVCFPCKHCVHWFKYSSCVTPSCRVKLHSFAVNSPFRHDHISTQSHTS